MGITMGCASPEVAMGLANFFAVRISVGIATPEVLMGLTNLTAAGIIVIRSPQNVWAAHTDLFAMLIIVDGLAPGVFHTAYFLCHLHNLLILWKVAFYMRSIKNMKRRLTQAKQLK